MRVAVTGTTGRAGAALAGHLSGKHEVICLPRAICELADGASVKRALDGLECDVLIHPAAITGLEACEDDPALAMRVNAEAPAELAAWADRRGVRMIHFSTDYVFDGVFPGLRSEDDMPRPLSVYGKSKLEGEAAVLAYPGHLVLRVSWVFGPEKPSFVDQVFDAALAGRPLAAVADKLSLPTFTSDLACWMDRLLELKTAGLLHACNPGDPVSWHGLAEFVVREMTAFGVISACPDIVPQNLESIPSFRAARPRFTAMDTGRLEACLGFPLRPWPEALAEYVRSRCALS